MFSSNKGYYAFITNEVFVIIYKALRAWKQHAYIFLLILSTCIETVTVQNVVVLLSNSYVKPPRYTCQTHGT